MLRMGLVAKEKTIPARTQKTGMQSLEIISRLKNPDMTNATTVTIQACAITTPSGLDLLFRNLLAVAPIYQKTHPNAANPKHP